MKSNYVKFVEDNKELETIIKVHDAIDITARILWDWPSANILRIVDIKALDSVDESFIVR